MAGLRGGGLKLCSVLEAPAFAAPHNDLAVVRQSIEKRGGQLPVAEDTLLLSEGEVGGGDDLCTLVDQAFLGRGILC